MNIAVFCSSREIHDNYIEPAKEFARLLAENGYNLVFGGSDTGLMKIIADEVQENGGKVSGVSIEAFQNVEKKDADEMFLAQDLGDRKDIMLEKAEAIVVLVGGLGTLDELLHITELKRQKEHSKPILILNTDNFYQDLINQFNKMEKEGFFNFQINDYAIFLNTPEEVIAELNKNLKY